MDFEISRSLWEVIGALNLKYIVRIKMKFIVYASRTHTQATKIMRKHSIYNLKYMFTAHRKYTQSTQIKRKQNICSFCMCLHKQVKNKCTQTNEHKKEYREWTSTLKSVRKSLRAVVSKSKRTQKRRERERGAVCCLCCCVGIRDLSTRQNAIEHEYNIYHFFHPKFSANSYFSHIITSVVQLLNLLFLW